MSTPFYRRPVMVAVVIGMTSILAPSARAEFQLFISVTGNGPSETALITESQMMSGYSTAEFNDFDVAVQLSTGGTGSAHSLTSTVTVSAYRLPAAETITVYATSTGYSADSSERLYSTGLNVSGNAGLVGSTTGSFQSFSDGANQAFATSTPPTSGSGPLPTPGGPSVTSTAALYVPLSATYASTPVSGLSTFSLTNITTLAFQSGANRQLVFSATTGVAVPEPSAITIIASGLPLVGLGLWRHRGRSGFQAV